LRFERGHLPAFIVAPRVADEQVVGHALNQLSLPLPNWMP
jgi:hypothetical protein